jgi:maltooligosyltrehalose trehalohydrolase
MVEGTFPLEPEADGFFSARISAAKAGSRYRFKLDDHSTLYPDPASRFQPDGPHGPSEVVDPWAYRWSDPTWNGISLPGQVLYEMHVGTFTKEGTWASAERELSELKEVGITCLEVMPVADFPGKFGWGYDGVNLFAPTRLYGTPDDFRRFVDKAHQLGIGVILDVVYNHLGPDGNYLKAFAPQYFTSKYHNEWGEPINFDGPDSGPVRDYFASNAAYWIDEFHLDGLRIDATQNIYDDSPDNAKHILAEIGRRVRVAANGRSTMIVNENEPQLPKIVRPVEQGGYGLDALWNDDFHHSAMVALTGRHEAYFSDYRGTAQEFVSVAKYGYLYQGQWYSWQGKRRGQPGLDLEPAAFIAFIQNHDQIANSARGLRVHQLTSPGRYRAMTALTLLLPGTPMLFMGQEFAADSPFLYFADHSPELAKLVRNGRQEFLAQFPSIADPAAKAVMAVPDDPATFERCKLDFIDRERHSGLYRLTKDLLMVRRTDAGLQNHRRCELDGAVLGENALVLRYFLEDGTDRLLVVNFGRDLHLQVCPEPLLAPPEQARWRVILHTEDPKYGGCGMGPIDTVDEGWRIMGGSAALLIPERVEAGPASLAHGRAGGGKGRIIY